MSKFNIIFLDIDGVLNSHDNMWAMGALGKTEPKDHFGLQYKFDERCVRWFKFIANNVKDCKVVLSSSWRYLEIDVFRQMWQERNMPLEILDYTPYAVESDVLNKYSFDNVAYNKDKIRGHEIQQWIEDHKDSIKRYCIINDESDMLEHQLEFFVKTDYRYGLDYDSAKKIIDIFNN